MNQIYNIAGLSVEMDTFGRTERQARAYLASVPCEPDIIVKGSPEEFQRKYPHFSIDSCEYMTTCMSFYKQLLSHNGFLLHSSAVVVDGRAYVFSAPSGTGKSTHTKLWLEKFGQRAAILNDDKPAIRLIDGEFYASGTPWSGKTDLNINTTVPLAGICILRRGEINKISPYSGSRALFELLEQTLRPASSEDRGKLMDVLTVLIERVPIWYLECNMSLEAAEVSYAAMSGENKEI